MTKQEAYDFMKSIMMMEFEETAVTGCVVRRPYPAAAGANGLRPGSLKPKTPKSRKGAKPAAKSRLKKKRPARAT